MVNRRVAWKQSFRNYCRSVETHQRRSGRFTVSINTDVDTSVFDPLDKYILSYVRWHKACKCQVHSVWLLFLPCFPLAVSNRQRTKPTDSHTKSSRHNRYYSNFSQSGCTDIGWASALQQRWLAECWKERERFRCFIIDSLQRAIRVKNTRTCTPISEIRLRTREKRPVYGWPRWRRCADDTRGNKLPVARTLSVANTITFDPTPHTDRAASIVEACLLLAVPR